MKNSISMNRKDLQKAIAMCAGFTSKNNDTLLIEVLNNTVTIYVTDLLNTLRFNLTNFNCDGNDLNFTFVITH